MNQRKIETVYPLSPVQHGILFHSLERPDSGVYVTHLVMTLGGELNTAAFERAWQRTVARHPILRTSFVWKRVERPLQVVHQEVAIEVRYEDFGELSAEEEENRVQDWLAADLAKPFDLTRAPLMRLAILRTGNERHQFVWSFHHILLDGWSMPLVLDQVFSFYRAEVAGTEVRVEASRPYGDYIQWLGEQRREAAEQYWRRALAGFEEATPLPGARARAVEIEERERAGVRQWQLPAELSARLQELARREQLTLNTVLQGAWGLLLSRYSRREEVVYGATVSGRPGELRGVERMVGLFINTLPVRVRVQEEAEVVAWLRELQEAQVAQREYEYSGLVEVQGWSEIKRGATLFDSIFVFENYPAEQDVAERTKPLTVLKFYSMERPNYPLALVAGPGERVVLRSYYDRGLFADETIERLLRQLQVLLEGIAREPRQRVRELSLVSEQERERLAAWNRTARAFPRESSIAEQFELQAVERPDAEAVVYGTERLSYRELNERANRLAHYLKEQGVGPEVVVGVSQERSVDLIVSLLGVLKGGGAYLPLDPEYPESRHEYMAAQAGARLVLSELPQGLNEYSTENLERQSGGDNLAYVMYTSGSTGRPKGIAVTQANVLRLVHEPQYVRLDHETVMLQLASNAFDAATFEIWGALLHGARLVLFPGRVASGAELQQLIVAEGVETLWLTSALYNGLVESGVESLAGVKQLLVGGEALSAKHIQQGLAALPETEFINGYGPTEVTTFSCTHRVRQTAAESWERGVPIGRPINNTEAFVLDERGQLLPVGVTGELYLGGEGLARGYVGDAAQTAEKFVPHAFAKRAGERLYRTGDLVRWRADGELEFVGRVDEQVKLRGYRIEPGEIEQALREHEAVQDAVVVVRGGEDEEKRLIAYVVAQASVSELRAHLRERLPEYMVPWSFEYLERLPLNPNGKVDRDALPEPAGVVGLSGKYVGPRTAAEEVLCGIWSEVLRVERVGVHDNFFALGGHSLLGMQVNSRMRQAFGVELPLRALFEAESLATLAVQLEGGRAAEAFPVRRVERNGGPPYRLPPSYAQQRLWFIDQYESGEPLYNLGVAFALRGELNLVALEQAFNDLIARHETLRTRFEAAQGEPVQVIEAAVAMTVPLLDLSGAIEREAAVQELIRREMKGKFDLSRGPLFRVWLVKTEEQEHVLLLVLHHIVTDEWSLGLMLRELSELYAAACAGRSAELSELPAQYGDYAMWQREMLQGEVLEQQLAYWRRQLGERKAGLDLRAEHARPQTSNAGASVTFRLPAEVTRAVRELNKREDVTLYMTLLAAWQLLLARYSHSEEVWVGTAVANRGRAEWEQLIGFLVNTVVIRTTVKSGATVRQLLREVRERCWEGYEHQDAPYDLVVEQVQRERDVQRPGLFEVMFSLQQGGAGQLELAGLAVSGVEVKSQTAHYDLTLIMSEIGDELVGRLEYRTDLYDAERVRRMVQHYEQLLAKMAANVEAPVWGLKFLSAAEEREQLEEWNRTARAFPRESSIAEQFELQAATHADAEAVVYGTERLSYRELNERANRLAHYLKEQGVGPEVVVGVSQERSIDLIVSLLGVLKAGGAYLPLDPEYPESRHEYMAAQAGAKLVLSELPDLAQRSTENLERQSGGDNLAYVMYTSGSTGRPKGIAVTQANVLRLVHEPQYVRLDQETVMLQLASNAFDAATFEIWGALLHRARLVLFPGRVASGAELQQLIAAEGVETLWLTSALYNGLVESGVEALAGVKQLLVGGEALSVKHIQQGLTALPETEFINGYGPTEVTTFSCTHRVRQTAAESWERGVPIGRPINNTEAFVLDERGQLLPVGVTGELYLGGEGLARGYVGDAAQTAEKFVPHVFAKNAGARLYRTGDLVRWRADGELEFVGRVDEQVKLRGYRIEPGEIEQALKEHEAVQDAVVVVRGGEDEEKRLIAYVVAQVGVNELRAHLRERLPEYMVPWSFEYLERLPLNANGKVDRDALPEPLSSPETTGEYAPPRTATEEILADIWSQVLGIPRVGIHDNFFEIGGHSLKATQVVSRIANDCHVQISVRSFFDAPTIAELAEIIRHAESTEESPLVHMPDAPHYELSYGQRLIWISSQFGKKSVYNIPAAFLFEGEFDAELFEAAYDAVVERHQILTTTIEVVDGEPRQRLNPQVDLKLQLLDFAADDKREAKAIEIANREAVAPLDLENGPLFRAVLLKLSATRHVFVLTMHHIISDGWSLSVFISELLSRYGAARRGIEFLLPPLNVQYQDFVAWQSRKLSTESLNDDRNYWLTTLSGRLSTLELPIDYPRPRVRTFNGAVAQLTIDKDLTAALYLLSRNYSATLFMTLLAGLDALFYRYTGHTDIILASPISGRTNKDLENQIGLFINMLPLRVRVHGEHTFAELLDQVRDVTLSAYEHQEYPFALMLKELNLERDPARPLLVNTGLTLQNHNTSGNFDSNELGFTITRFQQEIETSEYDLCFLFTEKDDELTASVNYNTDIFDRETIESMWSRLVSVFVQVTNEPELRVMDLELEADRTEQAQDLAIELNV